MFTIIMTAIGIAVFMVSLLFSGFARAFKRMLMFIAIGLCLDLATFVLVSIGIHLFS